jgi:hypothetical protein
VTLLPNVTTPKPTQPRAHATLRTRGIVERRRIRARRRFLCDKEARMFEPLEMPEPESPESDDDDIVIVDEDALN